VGRGYIALDGMLEMTMELWNDPSRPERSPFIPRSEDDEVRY
jgi:hypothetical protein